MRPMLAATVKDTDALPYPMIASPKLDGIRCLIVDGKPVSRKLKPIPNRYIQAELNGLPEGLDGELMVGESFQACTSGIMSHGGEPDFTFWIFDQVDTERTYSDRIATLPRGLRHCSLVPTTVVHDEPELLAFEAECLEAGFEGVCMRTPSSPYKLGRSTLREGYLLKLKRFVDAEATITGFVEQYHNTNALQRDALGHAKRSKTLNGRIGKGTLGKFVVRDIQTGVEFGVGTGEGLTDSLRREIWDRREDYLGKTITYKSQPFGALNAPRLPIFKGFRND